MKNKLRTFLIFISSLLGISFLTVFFFGGSLVQYLVQRQYPVTLGWVDLHFNTDGVSLEARDISSSDKSLSASYVMFKGGFMGLLSGELSDLQIQGLSFHPQFDSHAPAEVPDIEQVWGMIPLTIQHLSIKDAALSVPASDLLPEGLSLSWQLQGKLSDIKNSELTGEAIIAPMTHVGGGRVQFSYHNENLTLVGNLQGLQIADIPIRYQATVQASRNAGQPFALTGQLIDPHQKTVLLVEATSPNLKAGKLTFKLPAFVVTPQMLPIKGLGLDSLDLVDYGFNIAGQGSLTWDEKGLRPQGEIAITHGHLSTKKVEMSGLKFAFQLEELYPKRLLKQDVHIDLVKSPVAEVKNIKLSLLMDEKEVVLSRASCEIWDGAFYLSGLILSPLPSEQQTILTVEHVSLQTLVTQLAINKFSAGGRMNGQLPVTVFEDGSMAINGGSLKSSEPGHLSYQWDEALGSSDSNLKLAAAAIQNFNYDEVEIHVNKKRGEEPTLNLDIKGRNPKLLEGRSFDISINLSGKLLQTLESLIQSFEADIKDLRQKVKARKD